MITPDEVWEVAEWRQRKSVSVKYTEVTRRSTDSQLHDEGHLKIDDVMTTESDDSMMTKTTDLSMWSTEEVMLKRARVIWRKGLSWQLAGFCVVTVAFLVCGRYDSGSSPHQTKIFSVLVQWDYWPKSEWVVITKSNIPPSSFDGRIWWLSHLVPPKWSSLMWVIPQDSDWERVPLPNV